MLLALAGHFSAYAFAPVRHIRNVRLPCNWSLVVASSGVAAEKTGAAQRAYNHLVEASRVLLQLWNEHEPWADSLAAALASDESAAGRLAELIRQNVVAGWSSEDLQRRLLHFQSEDACVLAAVNAVDQNDADTLTEISTLSQRNAEQLLRQQVPQTSALAEAARFCGAFAACSFGAGFGGSVWALVERDRADAFAAAWLAQYRARYDAPGAAVFTALPGPALTEVRSSR